MSLIEDELSKGEQTQVFIKSQVPWELAGCQWLGINPSSLGRCLQSVAPCWTGNTSLKAWECEPTITMLNTLDQNQ